MLKEVVKSAKNSVKARVLPPGKHAWTPLNKHVFSCGFVEVSLSFVCHDSEVILKFRDLISKLEKDVGAVMRLEREERELAASEAKVHIKMFPAEIILQSGTKNGFGLQSGI